MAVHRALSFGILVFVATLCPACLAEDRPAGSAPPAAAATTSQPAAAAGPSDAERISRLSRSLQSDEKRLRELKIALSDPAGDYAEAEAEFERLDTELLDKKKQLEQLPKSATPTEESKLRDEATALEKKWTLARDRFELTIGERKAMQESVAALEEKLKQDHQALEELRGNPSLPPAQGPPDHAPSVVKPDPAASAPAAAPPAAAFPGGARLAPSIVQEIEAGVLGIVPEPDNEAPKELAAATVVARDTLAAALEAEHDAESLTHRLEILRKNITLARQLRDTARKKVDNADAALKSMSQEMFRKLMEGANADALRQEIQEATERVRESRDEARDVTTQLDELQSTLSGLQAEQLTTLADANAKRQTADQAAAFVRELNNPFTIHNLLQWLLDHGPKTLGILLAVGTLLRLSRIIEWRLVSLIANRGRIGNREERENRAKTLLGIFHNAANIVILGGGVMAILDEVGIPVTPLIGGAAVVGLAVAFGAQSLIKDYFTGFLVLLEQQYLVNDVVKIGDISGQVERITLRTTMLRDLEGRVHFIPHGQITSVTNNTHGWARAVFEVRVGYRENVDKVIETLMTLARELCAADGYREMVMEGPTMLGVEALSDAGMSIKFHIKTRPLQQWGIKRELLRRIKNKFDELGIEFPGPPTMIVRRDSHGFALMSEPHDRKAG